jgi:putative phage-type endonuclease
VEETPFEIVCNSSDREAWLAARRSGIGSSDAAAVVGVNPWRSALELYGEKLGLEAESEQSEAAYWGTVLEPLVLARFAKETGRLCRPAGKLLRSKRHPWQLATLDGEQIGEARGPGILEIKCTGLRENWEEGPPGYVVAQIQHQLAVTGWDWGSVAVLFGGREFFYRDFERDQEMIDWLTESEADFMRQIQRLEAPEPEGTEADKAMIAKLFPRVLDLEPVVLHGSFIEQDERREYLKAEVVERNREILEIENRIRLAIGEHESALLPSGVKYTLKLQHRPAYQVAASDFRVLRRIERK